MTTQPETQPPTTGPAISDAVTGPADVARVLDERIVGSVDVLYAHITAATLETVGRPRLLPTALFPDADPEVVEQVWQMAFMVGFLGGKRTAESRRWEHERLAAARNELAAAGYTAMADRIARVLPAPGTPHPADGETGRMAATRGGRS
ncbi:hypothetical protein [Streptomyces violaceusniger]|uniref:hypothetical protein n=1 Tax=Streptomyces violaceusniger TaxID=68280 RepID=UPI0037F83E70